MSDYPEVCFACGRRMKRPEFVFLADQMSDGKQYEVFVGPECFHRVIAAGAMGYQPPRGGPRLYLVADDANKGAAYD